MFTEDLTPTILEASVNEIVIRKPKSLNKLTDTDLIALSLTGDQDALDKLIKRYKPFIQKVCRKMKLEAMEMDDVTQEVLIKMVTQLAKFEGKSAFSTWLYKVTVNHIHSLHRKAKKQPVTFSQFDGQHDEDSDTDFSASISSDAPTKEESTVLQESMNELKMTWMAALLMCLNPKQRLTYLLGEVLHIDHKLGAKLMAVTPENYRQLLSRARKDLTQFMNHHCRLVDPTKECFCQKKTRDHIESGEVDATTLLFTKKHLAQMLLHIKENGDEFFQAVDNNYKNQTYFADLDGVENPDYNAIIEKLITEVGFEKLFQFTQPSVN